MAIPFHFTDKVKKKLLDKHNVTQDEVMECFMNRDGAFFKDTDERHETDPPSWWFCAETDRGRSLKVVFIDYGDRYQIKTAFGPTDGSDDRYKALCKKLEEMRKTKET